MSVYLFSCFQYFLFAALRELSSFGAAMRQYMASMDDELECTTVRHSQLLSHSIKLLPSTKGEQTTSTSVKPAVTLQSIKAARKLRAQEEALLAAAESNQAIPAVVKVCVYLLHN